MELKKKKVLIVTTKWGHFGIGQGVLDVLSDRDDIDIKFVNIEIDKLSDYTYSIIYKLFPKTYKLAFNIGEKDGAAKIARAYQIRKFERKVYWAIRKNKPDVVISAYFGFNPIIEKYMEVFKYQFINVIADPWTFSKMAVSKNAINLCFDVNAKKRAISCGSKPNLTHISGWFTRRVFYQKYSKSLMQKKLNIPANSLVFSIIGGSVGAYSIVKILPAFYKLKKKVHVVFICGESKSLYKTLNRIASANRKIPNLDIANFSVLGFIKNVDEYLKVSDMVIGKAGPNLIFECVATQKPFLAITHISGQEDGNLDLIEKLGIGYVEENPTKAIKIIRRLISNPSEIKSFDPKLEKLAEYNKKNSRKILDLF